MNVPYLIIPLSTILLVLYLISHFLSKAGIISRTLHKRIWNVTLLLAFLGAAILGLLLTIQINYKLSWSFVEPALRWHVNFGIALSVTAIIHLIWHLDYYIDIFKPGKKNQVSEALGKNKKEAEKGNLKPLILASGFAATVIQVLMIREISTVFQGNELLMGWTIGAWMLFTGSGALLGRKQRKDLDKDRAIEISLILVGILPVCFVILMNAFRNMIFPPGILINPLHFLLILLFVLAPVGLISGYLYALLVRKFQTEKDGYVHVYALEAIGSLVGGLMASMLFIYWFSVLQSLIVVCMLILFVLAFSKRKKANVIQGIFVLLVIVSSFFIPFDHFLKSFLFINQKIIDSRETYYGNVVITKNGDQYNLFENGLLTFNTDNVIVREEYAHYALLQRDNPKDILLIGGGVSGTLSELLKYPSVQRIDYVEINPQLIRTIAKFIPFPESEKIQWIYGDGRQYLQTSDSEYDIAILAIQDPSSLQANRFYTVEFLRQLKNNLKKGGIVMLSHSPAGNYVDSESAVIEGVIYHTLKSVFRTVRIIPGENDYFLASDSLVNINISELASGRSIDNLYVNPHYIDDTSIKERSAYIEKNLLSETLINTDKKPLPVFYHSLKFLSQFDQRSIVYLVLPVILLILPVFFMRSVSVGIFVTGFTGSAVELLLIFAFQTFYGYVYSALGLIIAVFMGGLAIGSIYGARMNITHRHFLFAQGILFAYALLFPLFWEAQNRISGSFFQLLLFFAVTFVLAIVVGFQYVAGTSIYKTETSRAATTLYGADLLGSALGVVAITLLLLPFLGMQKSCLVIAGLNFGAIVLNHFRKV